MDLEYVSNGLKKIGRGIDKIMSSDWTYTAIAASAVLGDVAYGAYTGQIQFVSAPSPEPGFSGIAVVAFSALAASLY